MSHATAEHPDLESAFTEHYAFVRARLRGLGVAPADLDDAAQDVFEVLVRRIADYDPRQSLRGWMAGMARRVARRYRERGQRRVVPLDERRPASDASPEDRAARREAWQVLQAFVDELEPARWSVFVLAEIEGLRGTEIAAELDLNLNTVYARLRSARTAFARRLARHHAREHRGLAALVLAWPPAWRGWARPGWLTGLAGSVALGSVAMLALAGARCGGDPTQVDGARTQIQAASPASEQPSEVGARTSDPATAFAKPDEARSEAWISAGSGYSQSSNAAGERYTLSAENAYRLERDRVIFERTYIGDDDVTVDAVAGHITDLDGLEIVAGASEWELAVPAGETRAVTITLRASREGVVGFTLRSGKPGGKFGGARSLRLVHERGVLRGCESNECDAPTASAEQHLSGETITVQLINECDVAKEFVVFAGDTTITPPASTPVYSLEPDERRTMQVDTAQWFRHRDADGRIGGGVQTDSDGALVRFYAVGHACSGVQARDPDPR